MFYHYDGSSNKIDLQSSRMFDVSKGVFLLSQSQKASIVEGVGQDIDIGVYDMKASKACIIIIEIIIRWWYIVYK